MLTRKALETMLMYETSQAIKHVGEKGHWHAGRQKLLESLLKILDRSDAPPPAPGIIISEKSCA